jgi:ribonuclease BN (tRNA processing enzyme)
MGAGGHAGRALQPGVCDGCDTKVRVLGCHGGELPGHKTTCFLLGDSLCVDAGAITSTLQLDEILRIDDIFLTHSHFDHIKDIPMMTDLLVGRRRRAVVVHGSRETIETMDRDVFNDRVWPDFRAIPTREDPVIALEAMPVYKPIVCQGLRIRAIPVRHPVHSVGYIIEGKGSAIAFSGDTGPTDDLWREINATPNVKAVFVELSFPSSQQGLADVSGPLTTRTVVSEL